MQAIDDLTWDQIVEHLAVIPDNGLSATGKSEMANRLFFKVQYEPGEVVMPQGVCSDFAGLLLEGCVRVVDAPQINQLLAAQQESVECWQSGNRWLQWFDRWRGPRPASGELALADPAARGRLTDDNSTYIGRRKARDFPGDDHYPADADRSGEAGILRPAARRLIGLTGAMWNSPRKYTLVAENDRLGNPCTLLLIKRKAWLSIEKSSTVFRDERKAFFLQKELAGQLLANRLFANTLYAADVLDWTRFTRALQAAPGREPSAAVRRLRSRWDAGFRRWFDGLDGQQLGDHDRYEMLRGLNTYLRNDGLFDESVWDREQLAEPVREILQADSAKRTRNQVIQLNRGLYEASLPGEIRTDPPLGPLERGDFIKYVDAIRKIAAELEACQAVGDGQAIQLLHFDFDPQARAGQKRSDVVYEQGSTSEGLYLLLSGRVKITRRPADDGEELLDNHLGQHGFFGLSCLRAGPESRHSETVAAMSQVDVVFLHRELVERWVREFPFLDRKVKEELERSERRAALQRRPPFDPPTELAPKLMAATNLLLIDMDLCTRCDQCVQACSDAHHGVGRFHRGNPDLRFHQWEVAGACVHCEDPPCQKACPVGAITVEFNSTVQVHRNRCIGCKLCASACPFDVIEMLPPLQHDRPLSAAGVTKNGVATKCDLCLTDTKDPPCVMGCPYGAAQRGAPRELFPGIKSWSRINPSP